MLRLYLSVSLFHLFLMINLLSRQHFQLSSSTDYGAVNSDLVFIWAWISRATSLFGERISWRWDRQWQRIFCLLGGYSDDVYWLEHLCWVFNNQVNLFHQLVLSDDIVLPLHLCLELPQAYQASLNFRHSQNSHQSKASSACELEPILVQLYNSRTLSLLTSSMLS